MAKKFFTRLNIQEILASNDLKAEVSYMDREDNSSPNNFIIYTRLTPNNRLLADDTRHMQKVLVQVTHFHKKKLDRIEGLMLDNFGVEPFQFDVKQLDTDYLADYYRFEVLTNGRW